MLLSPSGPSSVCPALAHTPTQGCEELREGDRGDNLHCGRERREVKEVRQTHLEWRWGRAEQKEAGGQHGDPRLPDTHAEEI